MAIKQPGARSTGWQVFLYDPSLGRKRYAGSYATEEEARWADRLRIDGAPKGPKPLKWGLEAKGETACRVCGDEASHLHHLVPQAEGSDERPCPTVAGIPLCLGCHQGWHHRGVTIHRDCLSEREMHYVVATMGEDWFYATYPPGLAPDAQSQAAVSALHALIDENARLRARVRELEGSERS